LLPAFNSRERLSALRESITHLLICTGPGDPVAAVRAGGGIKFKLEPGDGSVAIEP
jgi:hypothetical protein